LNGRASARLSSPLSRPSKAHPGVNRDNAPSADAPIEITGFGSNEIDQIVIGRDQNQSVMNDPSEAAAPPSSDAAVARLGDLFLLGPHRVICGNAADPDLVNRLMRTDVARMVFTDAPSPAAFGASVTVSEPREDALVSAAMTEDTTDADFLGFNRNWMNSVLPHLVDGGLLGTFIDWRGLPMAHAAAKAVGLNALDLVVAKTSAGAGSLYRSQHRLLPLFNCRPRQQHCAWQARTRSHQFVDHSAASAGSTVQPTCSKTL
jgi:hypothetical protein